MEQLEWNADGADQTDLRGFFEEVAMMEKVNLAQKLRLFQDHWSPKVVGELNDSYVKVVKAQGEFVWHHHEAEDELFLVLNGRLL